MGNVTVGTPFPNAKLYEANRGQPARSQDGSRRGPSALQRPHACCCCHVLGIDECFSTHRLLQKCRNSYPIDPCISPGHSQLGPQLPSRAGGQRSADKYRDRRPSPRRNKDELFHETIVPRVNARDARRPELRKFRGKLIGQMESQKTESNKQDRTFKT